MKRGQSIYEIKDRGAVREHLYDDHMSDLGDNSEFCLEFGLFPSFGC
jgi:hypothetical protein